MPVTLSSICNSRLISLVAALLATALPTLAYAQASGPAISTVLSLSGSRPQGGVVLGTDGQLYGVSSVTVGGQTGGLVYRVTATGSSVKTVYQLGEGDGIGPQTGLLLASDGLLYGTTHFGITNSLGGPGTVFRIRQDGSDFTTLHEFAVSTTSNQDASPKNTDGAFPDSALVEGSDGLLYGVTRAGGANGTGTVFRIAKDGTSFTTLRVFGAITSAADSGLSANADGAYPVASLIESNGYLYGNTSRGGTNARGVIFRLLPDGSGFQVLHVFSNLTTQTGSTVLVNDDGATLSAALLDGGDGQLYGVAGAGGNKGVGTLFAIAPDGSVFTTLHHFDSPNGSAPSAPMIIGRDGRLWGTTAAGGTNDAGNETTAGTIFAIARDGTGFMKIVSFAGSNGASPNSTMIQLTDTAFVGTTSSGGRCGEGTVFRMGLTGQTVDGDTSCGNSSSGNGGGGATSPLSLVLLLGGGWIVRRKASR